MRVLPRPRHEVAEVDREARHEGVVVEVDAVLLENLIDDAPHGREVVLVHVRVTRWPVAGGDDARHEQAREVVGVGGRELHGEVLASKPGEDRDDGHVPLGHDRGTTRGEVLVSSRPVDGDRDVQDDGVDAVLVDEEPRAVELLDELGLEGAETGEGELLLDRLQVEDALRHLALQQPAQQSTSSTLAAGQRDSAAAPLDRRPALVGERFDAPQVGLERRLAHEQGVGEAVHVEPRRGLGEAPHDVVHAVLRRLGGGPALAAHGDELRVGLAVDAIAGGRRGEGGQGMRGRLRGRDVAAHGARRHPELLGQFGRRHPVVRLQ